MLGLFFHYSLRQIELEKWRFALIIFGIALGISVYGSVRAINQHAIESFEESVSFLGEKSDFSIVSESGLIDQELYANLRIIGGIESLSPYSARYLDLYRGDELIGVSELTGIDILQFKSGDTRGNPERSGNFLSLLETPNAVIVSEELSRKLKGGRISLLVGTTKKEIEVINAGSNSRLFSQSPFKIVTDIANFQNITGDFKSVERFDVWTEEEARESVEERISPLLQKGLSIVSTSDLSEGGKRMTYAFRTNLLLLASIALIVGAVLIFSTINYLILKRKKDYALLLTLGAEPKDLFLLSLFDALFVGISGGILGTILAYFMTAITAPLVSEVYRSIYTPLDSSYVRFSAALAVELIGLAILISLLSACIPSVKIFSMRPKENLRKHDEKSFWPSILVILGGVFLLPAILESSFDVRILHSSIVYLGTCLIGYTLLIPWTFFQIVTGICDSVRNSPHPSLLLAFSSFPRQTTRFSLCVVAFTLSLTLAMSMTIMIGSFKTSVEDWITTATKADLYVSSKSSSPAQNNFLENEVVDYLRKDPVISEIEPVKQSHQTTSLGRVTIQSANLKSDRLRKKLIITRALPRERDEELTNADNGLFASEAYGQKYGKALGDVVRVGNGSYQKDLVILGFFRDYASEQGVLLLPEGIFETLYPQRPFSSIGIYLKEGTSSGDFQQDILKYFKNNLIEVRDAMTLRRYVLSVFDKTFRITYVLQAVSFLVALFVLFNTLTMQTLDKKIEFAILESLGAGRNLITAIYALQVSFLFLMSFFLASLASLLVSSILIFKVNPQFFGWGMDFVFPGPEILSSALAGFAVSLSSIVIPITLLGKSSSAESLKGEF